MAVKSAYDDILAMSATLRDPAPAVSQFLVSLCNITEGYEVMHSAPSIMDVRNKENRVIMLRNMDMHSPLVQGLA